MSEDIKWQAMAYAPKDGRRVLLLIGDGVDIKRFGTFRTQDPEDETYQRQGWFDEDFEHGEIEGTEYYLGWTPVPEIK